MRGASFKFLIALLFLAATINALQIASPQNNSNSSNSTVSFVFTPALNASVCGIYSNETGSFTVKSTLNASNESTNTLTANFPEARFAWFVSCANANTTENSSNYTITVDLTSPITPVVSINANTSAAVLSFNSSDAFSGSSYFEVYKNNSILANGTSTNYTDYAVIGGNSYTYLIKAFDFAGNKAEQNANATIQNAIAMTSPLVNTTLSSATISWNTTQAANATLKYGIASSNLDTTISRSSNASSHELILTPLAQNTTYYYTITSCSSTCVEQANLSFTTLAVKPPQYSSLTQTGNNAGKSASLSAFWTLGLGASTLSHFIFSTNNSGSWVNTTTAFNAATTGYSNASITLNSTVGVTTVQWVFYVNDSSNKFNSTPVQSIQLVFPTPTATPIPTPTPVPTIKPSATPTPVPTIKPSATPTVIPTISPTIEPVNTTVLQELNNTEGNLTNSLNSTNLNGSIGFFQAKNPFIENTATGLITLNHDGNASTNFEVNFTNEGSEGEFFLELSATNGNENVSSITSPVNLTRGESFLFAAKLDLPEGKVEVNAKVKLGNETITTSQLKMEVAAIKKGEDVIPIIVVIATLLIVGQVILHSKVRKDEKTE